MSKKFLGVFKLVIGLVLLGGASTTGFGEEFYKGKIIQFFHFCK